MIMKFYCNLEIKAKSKKHLEQYISMITDDNGLVTVKVIGRVDKIGRTV